MAILIIWSLFYHKVVDPKEMESLLMMPVLGVVPREKVRLNILNQDPKSSIAKSFRSLRSNLAIHFNFKNKDTLLVTSTQAGEGKTYISIKIASAYASLVKKQFC
jgi:tyrosine-protein kinase Etk/Wzc